MTHRSIPKLFQRLLLPPLSTGYQRWRRQFLLERIPLACSLGMGLQLFFLVFRLQIEMPLTQRLNHTEALLIGLEQWLPVYEAGLSLAMLLLIRLLTGLPYLRRSPHYLILLFPFALLIVPKLPDLLFLTPQAVHLNLVATIVFFYQAILLPVHWRSHLISQGLSLSLVSLTIVSIFSNRWGEWQTLGQFKDSDLNKNVGVLFAFLAIQILFAIIALLTVWVQERHFIREFELRDRLQLFLHAISHDLRPPVMGTIMLLEQIRDESGGTEISDVILEQMLASGDRQLKLIDSLTATHQGEAQLQLHLQPINLHDLVSEILQDLHPLILSAQATTTLLIPTHSPLIQADPLQLRRVYENLLANALQYNSSGLSLELASVPKGKYWYCTVRDNGRGMTPEQCEQLFERYNRAINARHPLHLGLGLYICRQIVQAHGGKIGVESQPGQGTLFWFTLAR